ncbi:MAG: hypothetical protein WA012_06050 [Rhodoferax sp.]|uniref:hypothetical protein n=1 Tax=Rhodoferax sp. TaxID=50421 RepID=UPI003BB17E29
MNLKKLSFPLIIGLVSAQKINLVGELYLGEIIAVAYVIFNITRLQLSKVERSFVIFALIWACAQLVSDIFNRTELTDALKGIFAPLVFITTFIFLINYIRNKPERLPFLLLGFVLGGLVRLLIFPTPYFLYNPWKWGLGSSLLGLYIIYFSFLAKKKNNIILFMVLMLFFAVSLYFDGRSMAVFPLISALMYIKFHTNKVSSFSTRLSGKFSGLKILLIVLPVLFVVNAAASAFFSSPMVLSNFSSAAAAKYRAQASGAYGILFGGRSEILVSGQAFLDKPLLGHGSWAKDKSGYLDAHSILRYQLGYSSLREDGQYEDFDSESLIPAHSYLMGAFVWAGLFGGLFWIIVLNNVIKVFIKNINFLPFYFYAGVINFIWAVFFSPFGASGRWGSVIFLAAFFSYIDYLNSHRN